MVKSIRECWPFSCCMKKSKKKNESFLEGNSEIEEDSENLINRNKESNSCCWPFSICFGRSDNKQEVIKYASREVQTEILIEEFSENSHNVDLNKKSKEIQELRSIIKNMFDEKLKLEKEIEGLSNIEKFENTENQKILAQSFYIEHLERKNKELENANDDIRGNSVSNNQYKLVEDELINCKTRYNTLCDNYTQLYNYVQSLSPANRKDEPPVEDGP